MAAQKLLVGCTVGLLASQAAGVAFEGAPKFDAGIAGKKVGSFAVLPLPTWDVCRSCPTA